MAQRLMGHKQQRNRLQVRPGRHETVLHSFIRGSGDGANPQAGLVRDDAGNLYGTTEHGGENDQGTVFKVDALFHETVLFSFLPLGTDGANPFAGLVLDDAGNLYGTTIYGGTDRQGTLFKVDPAGNETVLHSFPGSDGDGSNPFAGLILDPAGNLYGTTYAVGTVFKFDPAGNETVLHRFAGGNGFGPEAGVIFDAAGNLYGTTEIGGRYNGGTVFKVDPVGNETVLYRFTGANGDGATPYAGLIRDAAGNLYGTTYYGGILTAGFPYGLGTVFMLDPTGNETVLYRFTGADSDGANPYAGLVFDDAGNLYETTLHGGTNGQGIVFRLSHQ